jgi:hypothetical protein
MHIDDMQKHKERFKSVKLAETVHVVSTGRRASSVISFAV